MILVYLIGLATFVHNALVAWERDNPLMMLFWAALFVGMVAWMFYGEGAVEKTP